VHNLKKCLTPETILTLHARMIKEAQSKGHRDPEDIAQSYVERLLMGLHAKATVGQAYIDIIRLTSGSKRMPGYAKKQALTMVATQDAIDSFNHSAQYDTHNMLFVGLDIQKVMGLVRPGKCALCFSLLMAGLNQKEIAQKMGLTESRINQIISREIDRIRYKLDL